MSAADIEARRAEVVRALRDAGREFAAGTIESEPLRLWDALDVINDVGADDRPEDRPALRALALLLAAMTEPQ